MVTSLKIPSNRANVLRWLIAGIILIVILGFSGNSEVAAEDCRITPVLHVLQSPGCSPMTIPSFACVGKCTSYVQVTLSLTLHAFLENIILNSSIVMQLGFGFQNLAD